MSYRTHIIHWIWDVKSRKHLRRYYTRIMWYRFDSHKNILVLTRLFCIFITLGSVLSFQLIEDLFWRTKMKIWYIITISIPASCCLLNYLFVPVVYITLIDVVYYIISYVINIIYSFRCWDSSVVSSFFSFFSLFYPFLSSRWCDFLEIGSRVVIVGIRVRLSEQLSLIGSTH